MPDIATLPALSPQLTARWWQWALSVPKSVHPLRKDPSTTPGAVDPSSAFCMVGQHGSVVFLGGYFQVIDIFPDAAGPAATPAARSGQENAAPVADVVRECRIPAGAAILIPVVNGECDTAGEIALNNLDPGASLQEKKTYLLSCVKVLGDAVTEAVAYFGPFGGLRPLRVQRVLASRPFSLTYTPGNILGIEPAQGDIVPHPNPSIAYDDGFWALIPPPAPGRYVLSTFGSVPAFDFRLRLRYILTVVPVTQQ